MAKDFVLPIVTQNPSQSISFPFFTAGVIFLPLLPTLLQLISILSPRFKFSTVPRLATVENLNFINNWGCLL